MRFVCIFLILNLILNLTFGELTIVTKYVSFAGNDTPSCGTRSSPCKSIKHSINSFNPQYYDQLSIEILLESGNHFIDNSISLNGLNVTIGSATPGVQANIVLSSKIGNYVQSLKAPFTVHQSSIFKNDQTIIFFRDLIVSDCYVNEYGTLASFLESKINYFSTRPLKVQVENVFFNCPTYTENPFFSVTYGNDNSDSSSSNYQVTNKSPQSSPLYNLESTYDSSSSDYGSDSSYQPYSNVINQFDGANYHPMDLFNVSFTFNNCLINGSTNFSPLLFSSSDQTSPLVTITNTDFTNIVPYDHLLSVFAGKVVLENVNFSNISSGNSNGILNLKNSRVSFDKVNFSGNISSPIVSGLYIFGTFKQFDVNVNYQLYSPSYVFSFTNSWVSFENCTHSVQSSQNEDTTSGIFNVQSSDINLYSNRLNAISSNIIYSGSSSIWANNNIFNITFTHQSTNDYQPMSIVQCSSTSKLFGDYEFTSQNQNSNCNSQRTFTNFIYFNTIEVSLSFLAGVLSMSLLFVLIFSISACCKCKKRRNQKKINTEKQPLLSINNNDTTTTTKNGEKTV